MSYTITGTVHSVEAEQSKEIKGKTYKSRDIIISCPENINGKEYPNFVKLSVKLDKVLSYVANLKQGQTVTLHFNIKGYNGQKGNFTGLEVWKVDAGQSPQQQAPQQNNQSTTTQDAPW